MRVVVLAADGPAFSSGFDLREQPHDDATLRARFLAVEELRESLLHAPFVTVACIDGPAYGAGGDLALACDYRLGTRAVRFRFPGIQFGVVFALEQLAQLVGPGAARDLVVTGRVVEAEEARELGLLTELLAPEDIDGAVEAIVRDTGDLERETLRDVLAITRRTTSLDRAHLDRSLMRPGLAERLARFAARAQRLSEQPTT